MRTSLADAILAAVDAQAAELIAAVSAAVRISSVSPNFPGENPEDHLGGEARVARLVAEQLAPAGCEIDVFAVVEGRENCVGVLRGSGGGRSLILNGHTDVVLPQPAEEWARGDPWSGAVADGSVWGRGASDMKGGLMCQVFAVRALAAAGVRLRGDLLLQAVAGEEMMEQRLGTLACLERGYVADAAVVAEPSPTGIPMAVCPASCGFLLFELTVEGKAAHSAMRAETIRPGRAGAELGVHAIDKGMLVHQALADLEDEWGLAKSHPLFEPGSFTLHAGVVVGAPRRALIPFSLAEYMRSTYVVWYPPDEGEADIRAEIEARVTEAAAVDPWLRAHPPKVEWKQHWAPARLDDPDHPIVPAVAAAHQRAAGVEAQLAGFTAVCDASFLNAHGVPAISYGPGDIALAHAVDERVAVEDLITATKTFALLAADWCGTD